MTPRAREALAMAPTLALIGDEPDLLTTGDVRDCIRKIDDAIAIGTEIDTRDELTYVLWAWKMGTGEIPF